MFEIIFVILLVIILCWNSDKIVKDLKSPKIVKDLISVNYHISRQCNYACKFCFHTYTNDDMVTIEDAKKGMRLLKESGLKKINFAGGEPFLHHEFLGELIKFCKVELKLESVSIVTNASKMKESWFDKYGKYIDVIAVSCDSFIEESNIKIGRGRGNHLANVKKAKLLCDKHGIKFKINSVICQINYMEDMTESIKELNPFRWKVFQVLIIKGENDGNNSEREAQPLEITKEQFILFLEKHKDIQSLVPESNDTMRNSYILLDEKLRFLDCSRGGKEPTPSILEIGVEKAFSMINYDHNMFIQRQGVYDWIRDDSPSKCSSGNKELDW